MFGYQLHYRSSGISTQTMSGFATADAAKSAGEAMIARVAENAGGGDEMYVVVTPEDQKMRAVA